MYFPLADRIGPCDKIDQSVLNVCRSWYDFSISLFPSKGKLREDAQMSEKKEVCLANTELYESETKLLLC